jgi:hypothetical protein
MLWVRVACLARTIAWNGHVSLICDLAWNVSIPRHDTSWGQ